MGFGGQLVRLVERLPLSKDCTGREIHLLTLRADEPWHYAAGDWLLIPPCNPRGEVDQLLELLGCTGEESVSQLSLREVLSCQRTITRVAPALVEWLEQRDGTLGQGRKGPVSEKLALLSDGHGVASFLRSRATVPPTWQELLPLLRPLAPRAYSIASGPTGGSCDLRLLVATALYNGWDSGLRCGVCSTYLTRTLQVGDTLPCRVGTSRFHMPDDGQTDLILVGPGVGLAPFLGFLEQRAWLQATGHTLGRCWLFFGARNRATDFIGEDILRKHLESGILTRLDTAFSRDQGSKIYVQDRIRENGAELGRWLDHGACLYVCGDARAMARDVEGALVELVARHGELDGAAARDHVLGLRAQGRYRQDVY
ncbi:MAG: hypothetical protein LBT98_02745 [Puniceicoccales bacterium]|nr:hypothetical protein [Puniceicoccales bacterium]